MSHQQSLDDLRPFRRFLELRHAYWTACRIAQVGGMEALKRFDKARPFIVQQILGFVQFIAAH